MTRPNRTIFDRHLQNSDPGSYDQAFLVIGDQLNMSVFHDEVIRNKPLILFTESYEQAIEHPYHKKKLICQVASQNLFIAYRQDIFNLRPMALARGEMNVGLVFIIM